MSVNDTGLPHHKGTYALLLSAPEGGQRLVGRLGVFDFEPGVYVYIGSAFGPGGLAARVGRHCRVPRRRHWHIDYLQGLMQPIALVATYGDRQREHAWASLVSSLPASQAISAFGSSDCRCETHFFLWRAAVPEPAEMADALAYSLGKQAAVDEVRVLSPPTLRATVGGHEERILGPGLQ